jgi:hypothetical protein
MHYTKTETLETGQKYDFCFLGPSYFWGMGGNNPRFSRKMEFP